MLDQKIIYYVVIVIIFVNKGASFKKKNMIKQIKKPNIILNHCCCNLDLYYFDTINKYFIVECTKYHYTYYFNEDGNKHRYDGFAYIQKYYGELHNTFILNNKYLHAKEFAEKTDHLLCSICNKFCKQQCL